MTSKGKVVTGELDANSFISAEDVGELEAAFVILSNGNKEKSY